MYGDFERVAGCPPSGTGTAAKICRPAEKASVAHMGLGLLLDAFPGFRPPLVAASSTRG